MASTSAQKLPSINRKKLKRVMLSKPDAATPVLDKPSSDRVTALVCEYVKRFEDRKSLNLEFVFGFNTISRKAEICDDDLKIVLVNASVEIPMMISNLVKLCDETSIPVGCLEDFTAVTQAFRPLVLGLKPSCVAIGIRAASSAEFQAAIREILPEVKAKAGKDVPIVKRARLPPPPRPVVDVQSFYLQCTNLPLETSTASQETSFGDQVRLTENELPIVDYDNFIGSERPLEIFDPPMETDRVHPTSSQYKQPVMRSR